MSIKGNNHLQINRWHEKRLSHMPEKFFIDDSFQSLYILLANFVAKECSENKFPI
jgi:hypothetical protein